MPRRFGFGSIASPPFVLLHPGFCDQQATIEQLADGIGKVDMGLPFKEIADGEGNRPGSGDLVGRSKCGADIAAPIPGHLRVIFEIQQKSFFHLTTEGLPSRPGLSRFKARNPSRDALSGNFE